MHQRAPSTAGVMTQTSRILSKLLIAGTTVVMLPRLTPIGNGDFFSHATVAERAAEATPDPHAGCERCAYRHAESHCKHAHLAWG